MRTNTQQTNQENPKIRKIGVQTIAAAFALAMAFTFNACSSDDSDDNGSLESLLANNPWYQHRKNELEYYDPDNSEERCTAAGVVERKCKIYDEWYNPLKHACTCSDNVCELGTLDVCGSEFYEKYPSGIRGKCENNVLLPKCGNAGWYNRQTQQCNEEYNSSTGEYSYSIEPVDPKDICNGVRFSYYEGERECRDGVVKGSCGNLWYNRNNITWYGRNTTGEPEDLEYCDDNDGYKVKPLPKCGGMYMDGHELAEGSERCATDGKTLERECYGKWYNPITQACNRDSQDTYPYTYTLKDKTKCSK